jgi:adenylylsulfate kinase-like enzyme
MPLKEGCMLWISGKAGTGRTTFAVEMRARLLQNGLKAKLLGVLESDELFTVSVLSPDEVAQRVSDRCEPLLQNGFACILVEGYLNRATRQKAQQKLDPIINVLIQSPQGAAQPEDVDTQATVKGTHNQAKTYGEFEEPAAPDITFQTGKEPLVDGITRLMKILEDRGLISHLDIEDEEQMLIQRLKDLGYL